MTPAKKAAPTEATAAKKAAPKTKQDDVFNPDELAQSSTKKAAPKPDPQDAYNQLALEWALRKAFDGPVWAHARRRVEKEPMISEAVRQVLLDRIDLMG